MSCEKHNKNFNCHCVMCWEENIQEGKKTNHLDQSQQKITDELSQEVLNDLIKIWKRIKKLFTALLDK